MFNFSFVKFKGFWLVKEYVVIVGIRIVVICGMGNGVFFVYGGIWCLLLLWSVFMCIFNVGVDINKREWLILVDGIVFKFVKGILLKLIV